MDEERPMRLNTDHFVSGKTYAVFIDEGTFFLNRLGFNVGYSVEKIDTLSNNTNNITIFTI